MRGFTSQGSKSGYLKGTLSNAAPGVFPELHQNDQERVSSTLWLLLLPLFLHCCLNWNSSLACLNLSGFLRTGSFRGTSVTCPRGKALRLWSRLSLEHG